MRNLRLAACTVALSVLFPVAIPAAGNPSLTITNYHLLSEVRQTRTTSLFTYSADLVNTGQAQPSITATVTSSVPSIVVQSGQGSLHFPPVGTNATVTSTDFFTVMVDRTGNTDFANLTWTFSTPVANAGPNQTVATGSTVTLNGSASTNPSGIGTLTYSWAFASGGRPAGSAAVIQNPTAVMPTFVADVPGTYTITLTVSNGAGVNSANVIVATTNSPPVADAGPNQSIKAGSTVTLNGSASHDVDGDPLTYSWTLVAAPAGSIAFLTNPTSVSPTFVADKTGTYKAQLIVNDGHANSAPAQVTITSNNTPPVANAGPNQVVSQGSIVQLSGALSTDVDGNPLTYHWSFNSNPSSTATLSNPNIVNPVFTADVAGTYILQLIVNDGFDDSAAATVTITTNAILAPTANAGPNQTVAHGATVTLSGSGTDPQGLPLTFHWSFSSKPSGSTAVLSNATAVSPTFTADLPGTYIVQLIVNNGTQNSPASMVTITTTNTPPVANAGPSQVVSVGTTVALDGSGSSDADHDPLTYFWSLTAPAGSNTILLSPNTVSPTFVADVAGAYVAQLIVKDPYSSSAPATVTIVASSTGITLTPNPLEILLNGTGTLTVTIGVPAGPGGQAIKLGVIADSVVSAPATVTIPENQTSTTVVVTPVSIGTTQIIASAPGSGLQPGFTTVDVTAPTIALSVSNSTVGVSKTVTGTITLSAPAPAGGVTVSLSAVPTTTVTFPATVNIAGGASTAQFTITGAKSGTATITASSTNYLSGSVGITAAALGSITLDSGVSVVSGQSVNFGVSLVSPAPAGGVTITLVSADTTKLTVTPSVFIAAGATTPAVPAQVTGVNFGVVSITASAGGFDPVSTNVTVIAGLVVSPSSLPDGTVNTPYPQTTISATGGTLPYTLSVVNLPSGLSFNTSTGVISGTPTATGTATFTVKDAGSPALQGTLTLKVNPEALVVSPTSLPSGTAGQDYTATTISATGGTPPYVLTATGLPTGLTLNPTTGVLSGTPTVAGTGTITVKDSAASPQSKTLTVTIAPAPLVIAPTSLPNGTVGIDYPQIAVSATGGTTPYIFSATNLPAGLSFNTTTGVLSGKPTGFGTGTITVTDSGTPTPQTKSLNITVVPGALTILPVTLPTGTANALYPTTTVTASGGVAPYTFSSANLPAGLNFNPATGVLSGTPTTFGSGTITVTDSASPQGTKSVAVIINPAPLTTTPSSLAVGTANQLYPTTTIVPAGGVSPYTFSSTALPNGLTFNTTTGVLSGTPTLPGTATITVKDSAASPATVTLQLTINPTTLVVSPASLPAGAVGAPYPTTTISATGGTPPYILSATNLLGLSFDTTTGVLSGTPTGSGTVTITVKDSATSPQTGTRTAVIASSLTITPNPLPTGIANTAYPSTTIVVTGGNGPYTLVATGLPTGLSFNATTGVLSGTPTAFGTGTITATDSTNPTHLTNSVQVVINPSLLVVSPTTLPNGAVGAAYTTTTVTATGGTPPYILSSANIPSGMSFIPATGVLSGTPSVAGTGSVTVTDSGSTPQTKTLTFTINQGLTVLPTTLPVGAVGVAYPSTTVTASGGTAPYVLSATGLPTGLSFNTSTGVISGTPQAAATATITVTDSTPGTHLSVSRTLTINTVLQVTPATLPIGTAGVAYTATTVVASGGTTPYILSVTGLPSGLTFNTSTGVISGTPAAAATATITVTDSTSGTPQVVTRTLTINPAFTVAPATLTPGVSGQLYPTTTLVPSGGLAPYTFAVSGLPTGLTFNPATGVISGTPNANATVTFTITDSTTPTANVITRTLVIGPGVLQITQITLPQGTQNNTYPTTTVHATGGTQPYNFTATGLPTGLSIRSTGDITGIPSVTGTFSVVVTVTDAATPTGTNSATFQLVVVPAPLSVSTTSLPAGNNQVAYPNNSLVATGGTTPYTWSIASGSLPDGLSLNAAGRVQGTPTATAVSTTVVFRVTDSTSPTAMTALSGSIPITITPINNNPFLTITGATVGKDLETPLAVTMTNFTANTNVTISSDNPNVLLSKFSTLSCDLNTGICTGGQQSITINIINSNFVVYVEGLASSGSANITAHATTPNSTDGTSVVTLAPSGFVLSGPNGVGGSLLLNQNSTTPISVIAKQLDSAGNPVQTQQVRSDFIVTCPAPGPQQVPISCTSNPVVVPLNNSNHAAGSFPASVSFGGGVDTISVNFVSAPSVSTPTNTVLTATPPATFSTPAGSANIIPVTVQPTSINPTNATVGKGLETTAQINLGAKVTATTPVVISSNDPTQLLLSASPDVAGQQSITLNVSCNQTGTACASSTQPFYVIGLASSGTIGYTATVSGLGSATGLVTMTPSGFVISNPFGGMGQNFNAVTGNSPSALRVDPVRLDSAGNFAEFQSLAGTCTLNGTVKTCSAPPLAVTVTSSKQSVGTVTTPVNLATDSSGNSFNSTQFTPVGAGSTLISLTMPAGFTTPVSGSSLTAIVNNPGINLNGNYTIGQDLEQQGTFFLGVPAPSGGAQVLLTVTAGALQLSNTPTGAGSTSITVNVPAGQFVGTYYMFARSNLGTATVTAQSTGYNTATTSDNLAPSGIVVSDQFLDIDPLSGSFDISTNVGATNVPVLVSAAVLDPNTLAFVAAQPLAPTSDGQPLQVTVQNGTPTVGTIPSSVTIAIGSASVTAPFNALTVGSTQITARPTGPSNFTSPTAGRAVTVDVNP